MTRSAPDATSAEVRTAEGDADSCAPDAARPTGARERQAGTGSGTMRAMRATDR